MLRRKAARIPEPEHVRLVWGGVLLSEGPTSRILLGQLQEASLALQETAGESASIPPDVLELRPYIHGRDVHGPILQFELQSG